MPKARKTHKVTAQDLKTRGLLRQIGLLYEKLAASNKRFAELQCRKDSRVLTVEWDTNRTDLGDLTLMELRELSEFTGGGTPNGTKVSK